MLWEAGIARGKAHTPEEIVAKPRQVEVLVGQGKSMAVPAGAVSQGRAGKSA
jgi:hypothetical protein